MKKYMVMLDGRNFEIEIDGKVQKLGFFTTRWVEAINPKEAELKAVELIKTDESLVKSVRNSKDSPPMIYLSELSEIDSFAGITFQAAAIHFIQTKAMILANIFLHRPVFRSPSSPDSIKH